LRLRLNAPESVSRGAQFTYSLRVDNRSPYALNGAQAVFELPNDVAVVGSPDGGATQIGQTVVVTVGRLAGGTSKDIHLTVALGPGGRKGDILTASASLRSSTALSVEADEARTRVSGGSDESDDH
jgi:hypothetical protein